MVTLRGKLRYVGGDTRLAQCPSEPLSNPPLWVLLAYCVGGAPDTTSVTQTLQNANWNDGDCAAVYGDWLAAGQILCVDVHAGFIVPCPNGPC
jgi:hypothetical protein